jgi:hypothetical protein
MTPAGIHALRKAAALAHHVRGVRVRLTHDGAYLAEVGHGVVACAEGNPVRLTPCQLRVALSRVIGDAVRGRGVAAFGLDAGIDPTVHLGVCRDGALAVHAFGLITDATGAATTCTFVTTIGEVAVAQLLDGSVDDGRPELIELRVRTDAELGTSVVELRSDELDHASLVVVAYRLLAACGAEELDAPWCPRHQC